MNRGIVTGFALATLLSGCPKQNEAEPLFINRDIELPEEDDDLDELPEADTGEEK